MRWHALFSDLNGQFDSHERLEFQSDVADLTRGERASIALAARVKAAVGMAVTVSLITGEHVTGEISDAAAQWLLVSSQGTQTLIPVHAVTALQGLPPAVAVVSEVDRRLSLGHVLRALSRDRARVGLRVVSGTLNGTIDAVGADYLDLQMPGLGARTVPFAAVVSVRSL